jgi:hypothetical protein
MQRAGGCACGAIRFRTEAALLGTGACHCTACQKLSGGGPNYVVLVPKGAITVTQGEPKLYHSKGDSGGNVARVFCGDCGTPLWSLPEHAPFMTIKTGAFDAVTDLGPRMHIYLASAPAWHQVTGGVPTFPKMPPANAAPPAQGRSCAACCKAHERRSSPVQPLLSQHDRLTFKLVFHVPLREEP